VQHRAPPWRARRRRRAGRRAARADRRAQRGAVSPRRRGARRPRCARADTATCCAPLGGQRARPPGAGAARPRRRGAPCGASRAVTAINAFVLARASLRRRLRAGGAQRVVSRRHARCPQLSEARARSERAPSPVCIRETQPPPLRARARAAARIRACSRTRSHACLPQRGTRAAKRARRQKGGGQMRSLRAAHTTHYHHILPLPELHITTPAAGAPRPCLSPCAASGRRGHC
jgi:hypothetical protein